MKFVKTFSLNVKGRTSGEGSIIIADRKMAITVKDNTVHIAQVGLTEDGIGVEVEHDDVKRKTPYVKIMIPYTEDDLPEQFQGSDYKFSIPATKLSDTEYLFRFCNAKMLNKK